MKYLIKVVIISLVATTLLFSDDIKVDSIGVNVGVSGMHHSKQDKLGSLELSKTPDNIYVEYDIYALLGNIFEDKDSKVYVNYTFGDNSDLQKHMLLVGLHKELPLSDVNKYYIGVFIGYGMLDWQYNPLNNSKDNDAQSYSPIFGVNVGLDYPISQNYSVVLGSKVMLHEYETHLQPNTSVSSTISSNYSASLSFGLRYDF